MCFRPAEITKPVECPNCGRKVPTMAGIRQKKCPFCKTELPEETIPCPHCGVDQPISNKVCGNCGFNGKPNSGDPDKKKA